MRRPVTAIAAASTLCIAVAAAEAPEPPGTTGTASETSSHSGIDVQVPDSHGGVDEYWTRDRMRAAKPMPKAVIPREPDSQAAPDDGSDSD